MNNTTLVNFGYAFKRLKNKGYKISSTIDTLVYMDYIDQEKNLKLKELARRKTANTAYEFYNILPGLEGYIETHYTPSGFFHTLHIQHDGFNFPAVQYYHEFEHSRIKTTFYGLFFRFCKIHNFDFTTLFDYIDFFDLGYGPEKTNIVRFDLAHDVQGVTPYEFMRCLQFSRKNKKAVNSRDWQIHGKGKNLETRYIGSKGNKYLFYRVYDKILDNKIKKKQHFYFDYEKKTTRIEGQYGSNFCKGLTLEQITVKALTHSGLSNDRKDNYYVGKRYDPDIIADIERARTLRRNSTLKLMKNGFNLREDAQIVTREQDIFKVRIIEKRHPMRDSPPD